MYQKSGRILANVLVQNLFVLYLLHYFITNNLAHFCALYHGLDLRFIGPDYLTRNYVELIR